MVREGHPASAELEAYALGTSSTATLEKVEEHLRFCERCQKELAMQNAIAAPHNRRRLRSIHITEDGPLFGATHKRADGKWIARHWGGQLDGRRICDSVKEATDYLTESFHQMFPEHVCAGRCRG